MKTVELKDDFLDSTCKLGAPSLGGHHFHLLEEIYTQKCIL